MAQLCHDQQCLISNHTILLQEAVGSQIEAAYRNTTLKQERGKQIEAIKQEAHRMFDSTAESDLPLLKTAVDAVAASLGGLGGLGASSSKPDQAPGSADEDSDEEEVVDDTLKTTLAKNAVELLPEAQKSPGSAQQRQNPDESPSVPPPEAAEATTSGRADDDAAESGSGAGALLVSRALKVVLPDLASFLWDMPSPASLSAVTLQSTSPLLILCHCMLTTNKRQIINLPYRLCSTQYPSQHAGHTALHIAPTTMCTCSWHTHRYKSFLSSLVTQLLVLCKLLIHVHNV